ncbi:MAG: SulP family inorganic anion transporter, partial [Comamonadaceae bacterium]
VGVAIGIFTKFAIHLIRGVKLNNLFKIDFEVVRQNNHTILVGITGAAIFSNMMALKKAMANLETGKTVVFQLNNAYFLDHTVMEFFHDFQHDYEAQGGQCQFLGLEYHEAYADHPLAARRIKHGWT